MSYSVLVVDDHHENRVLANFISSLEDEYDIHTVAGSELCGEVASIIHPDLIILDTSDSRINYHQLCQYLRNNPFMEETPFLFLSDDSDCHEKNTWVTNPSSAEDITKVFQLILARQGFNSTIH